jgi:hypothetical protein
VLVLVVLIGTFFCCHFFYLISDFWVYWQCDINSELKKQVAKTQRQRFWGEGKRSRGKLKANTRTKTLLSKNNSLLNKETHDRK